MLISLTGISYGLQDSFLLPLFSLLVSCLLFFLIYCSWKMFTEKVVRMKVAMMTMESGTFMMPKETKELEGKEDVGDGPAMSLINVKIEYTKSFLEPRQPMDKYILLIGVCFVMANIITLFISLQTSELHAVSSCGPANFPSPGPNT